MMFFCIIAHLQDTIFNGRFGVNVPGRILAYKKKLRLPNGANIAVNAGAQYLHGHGTSFLHSFKPFCGFQMRFGSFGDGTVVYAADGFRVKQRVPVPLNWLRLDYPKFDLETYATVRIPQLTTRFGVQNDELISLGSPFSEGRDSSNSRGLMDDSLHLHIQGINAVIRL